MAHIIKIGIMTRFTNFWMLFFIAMALFMLALYLFLAPLPYARPEDRYVFTAAIAVLAFAAVYIAYQSHVINTLYNKYLDLLKNIKVVDNKLVLPTNSIVKINIIITRYLFRGRTRADIKYDILGKINSNSIELNNKEPYLFIGRRSSIEDKDNLLELYYNGTGYIITYEGIEYLVIILHPYRLVLENTRLTVSRDRDYGEAEFSFKDHIISTKIYYRRESSRGLKLSLIIPHPHILYSFKEIDLYKIGEEGLKQVEIKYPVLEEPHILIMPFKPLFISSAKIKLSRFKYRDGLFNDAFVLGFNNARLKLTLDIPFGKDVSTEATLKTLPM